MNYQHRLRSGFLAGSAVIAMGLLSGASVAHAAVNCVVSANVTQTETTVTGTSGDDTIDCGGASPGKTIDGLAGNDTITGTAFDDTINGGDGNDTITSGPATSLPNDTVTGGNGNDTLTGSAGNDSLSGGRGDDTLTGSAGNDSLRGGDNDDTLNGGVGNDSLNGGFGTDILQGDAGDDTLVGSSSDGSVDQLNGGEGIDTCQGPPPDGDVLVSCELSFSAGAAGKAICEESGGLYADVSPLVYSCVLPLAITPRQRQEAKGTCEQNGGTFVLDATSPLIYNCVLPSGTLL